MSDSMTIVIITEKPDASLRIANALAESNLRAKKSKYNVTFYEFTRNGKKHIVLCAVGHLFNLKHKGRGQEYPIFDVRWVPSFEARKQSSFSKKYFKTIEELGKNGFEYYMACDYDNEGSTIGYNILRFICEKDDGKRMKFSTLTKLDLIKAYDEASEHLDFNNIEAGIARHILDFYYGVNTSRALTLAVKKHSKRFYILSTGRVQGPTLTILAKREDEIIKFVPTPYWQIQLTLLIDGTEAIALYEKDKIWKKEEAERIFKDCKNKPAIIDDVQKKRYRQNPPNPFNITSLQTEAYRLFGYSPQKTLSIAQTLYTRAYISYPRTSSEKFPPQIGYKQILESLSKIKKYSNICKKLLSDRELKPTEGRRIDPAHEAIHPTIEPPKDINKLKASEQKIYDLICRRFFAVFGKDAIRESMKITIDVNKHKFLATGRRTIEKGWIEYYGPYAKFEEVIFPDLKKGDVLNVKKLEVLDKETFPPPRYSQASIIKEMEKRGLGTRATRATILQTLYDRNYITERSIRVTNLGLGVAEAIEKYVSDFADEKLTRRFEIDLEKIAEGKLKKEKIINKAKTTLIKICDEFKKNEDKIGKELGEAIIKTQEDKSILGPCPNCGKNLKIMFSPKTRKHFVGCSGYKDGCKTSFPLPPRSKFQRLDKICDKCKTPIIRVIRWGRRPFNMCLDPNCETKANWKKSKKK